LAFHSHPSEYKGRDVNLSVSSRAALLDRVKFPPFVLYPFPLCPVLYVFP